MRLTFLFALVFAVVPMAPVSSEQAEPREQYLDRLKAICEVECLQARPFQRAARKRETEDTGDMAIIMDVAYVGKVGSIYELHNINREVSPLEELDLFASAGIDTSSSTGIGGRERGGRPYPSPNVVIIEIDQQTLFDLLGPVEVTPADARVKAKADAGQIIVDETRGRQLRMPGLIEARAHFMNRRVVVRGQPRLEPTLIGARLDFRRKQVILELGNADYLALLPRYDDKGQLIDDGEIEAGPVVP
jgi:hypothetical protein